MAILVVLPSAFTLGKRAVRSWQLRAAEVGGPFAVTQQEVLTCRNNDVTAFWTEARASDGSRSTVIRRRSGRVEKKVRKASGILFRAFEHTGVKSTIQIGAEQTLGRELDPTRDCLETHGGSKLLDATKEGEEVLFGFQTVKIVTLTGDTRITAWHAPSLGCVPLRRVFEQKNGRGDWIMSSLLETTHVAQGEPATDLFRSDAHEMAPSAVAEALVRKSLENSQLPPSEIEAKVDVARERAAVRDQSYFAHRPQE